MDEQGVDYAMMYPTLASLVEERMKDDPDLCADAIHALNQWMIEAWPYTFEHRIFSTPVIATGLVDRAMRELDFAVEHGARAILMRPAPAWGYRGPRCFALAEFDPFWRNVEESGVLVVLHASDSGYNRYTNEWEGAHGEALAFGEPSLFSLTVEGDYRAVRDAATSLICHGALQRFPKLRIALVENGGGWVPHFLEQLDHAYEKAPHRYEEQPSATFKRHFWMHPFHEEDPRELVHLLGADHVIFGSDFPHIEGLADPAVVGRGAARPARRRAPSRHGRQHDAAPRHLGLIRGVRFRGTGPSAAMEPGWKVPRGRRHPMNDPVDATPTNLAELLFDHPFADDQPLLHGSGQVLTAGVARARARVLAADLHAAGVEAGHGVGLSGQRSRLRRRHDGHLAGRCRLDPDQRPAPRERRSGPRSMQHAQPSSSMQTASGSSARPAPLTVTSPS